jgi:hypothetical protein
MRNVAVALFLGWVATRIGVFDGFAVFEEGVDVGYERGYEEGMRIGHIRGVVEGVDVGHLLGFDEGYMVGYEARNDGKSGYSEGFIAGIQKGFDCKMISEDAYEC